MSPRHAGWVLVGRLGCHDRGSQERSELARAVREALGDFNGFGDPNFFGGFGIVIGLKLSSLRTTGLRISSALCQSRCRSKPFVDADTLNETVLSMTRQIPSRHERLVDMSLN